MSKFILIDDRAFPVKDIDLIVADIDPIEDVDDIVEYPVVKMYFKEEGGTLEISPPNSECKTNKDGINPMDISRKILRTLYRVVNSDEPNRHDVLYLEKCLIE